MRVVRIEWTRLSGDDIEEMLAIMLLREFRYGRHVKALLATAVSMSW